MDTLEKLITDEQINNAWGYANFGENLSKRKIIANALLKCASGYHNGHTIDCICKELGLITQKGILSKAGKHYLYVAFETDSSL